MAFAVKDVDIAPSEKEKIATTLLDWFRDARRARSEQIDSKALRWEKNYAAIPMQKVRTTPFARASNFVPQITRMHCDILSARVVGIIDGTKPFWRAKAPDGYPHEIPDSLGLGINCLLGGPEWFTIVDTIVNQSFQKGTLVLKTVWEPGTLYDSAGKLLKSGRLEHYPIAFEDFWTYPATAPSIEKSDAVFQRIRMTKSGIEDMVQSGRWPASALKVMPEQRGEQLEQARAEDAGIILDRDASYPYSVIEAWFPWTIGGRKTPIAAILNPELSGDQALIRLFHSYSPGGDPPYFDFRPFPRAGLFWGYSVPEILEQSQEEAAQIHNARRDASMIANVPAWKKKRHSDSPNPATEWWPGCVIEVEDMDDLEPLVFQTTYNSMIDEEQYIESLAERYIGISPSMQGYGSGQAAGSRGVYATGATLALLSEGNRRLDIFIKRLRAPFGRLGKSAMESVIRFEPSYFNKIGETHARAIQDASRGGLYYDLSASDASSNREIDRQSLLQMANVMASYYQRIVEASQLVSQVGPDTPMGKTLVMVLDGARDLAGRLLFAFDIGDRDRLLPDLRQALGQGAGGETAEPVRESELEGLLRGIGEVPRSNSPAAVY